MLYILIANSLAKLWHVVLHYQLRILPPYENTQGFQVLPYMVTLYTFAESLHIYGNAILNIHVNILWPCLIFWHNEDVKTLEFL